MIQRFTESSGRKIGVTRKTLPALRRTACALVLELLQKYGIYERCQHDKTMLQIHFGDNLLDFFSLDDPTKIQSADYNYLWMEEAMEFSWEDFVTFRLRMRTPREEGERNQIYMSLNPTDANSWIAQRLPQEAEIIHSTYHDNPYLDSEYIRIIEDLQKEDPNFYRIYALGEWGRLENLIYTKYDKVDELPQEVTAWGYGLDFGYVNPTSLVKVAISGGKLYLQEVLYKSKVTNADLVEYLSHQPRGDIWADSAEPARIEEICRAGYVCYPGSKDVKYGIDLMKRQHLNITADSPDIIKEIRGYQRKKDKNGTILEEPVKFNDHAMDAARYALAGLTERYGLATAGTAFNKSQIHSFRARR